MCQGGQGNFNMQRPGFTPGGANDPAQGGSGYYGGGSASWGGNYGNQIDPNMTQGPTVDGISSRTFSYPAQGGGWGNPWGGQGGGWGNPWGGPVPEGNWGWSPPVQNPGMPPAGQSPIESTETSPPADPFAGISAGRLGQAQRFANAGMFGRAKQQIGLGGGNWADVGGLLRKQAGETENYGGDWNWGGISDANLAQAQRFANAGMMGRAKGLFGDDWNKQMATQLQAESRANPYTKGTSMGFDWGDATAGRLARAKEFATAGKMGRAKQMYERGGGKWSPTISNQFRAWAKANQ